MKAYFTRRIPILSLIGQCCRELMTSNRAAHLEILRIMIHEGEYDPMEEANGTSLMHEFEGSSAVYRWLLDQEEFYIDFYQRHAITGNIASSLIHSEKMDSSKCLEAVIRRGSDVNDSCGWIFEDSTSLAHVAACSIGYLVDNLDFPKRIKALRDAGLDFHARKINSAFGTPFDALLATALFQVFNARSDFEIDYNKHRERFKSVPKPPTGSTRRVVDYVLLDPTLEIRYRPRVPRALWWTWNGTEGYPTWGAIRRFSLLEMMQRYCDAWLEVLLEAGLDIADYGRREERLHPGGVFLVCVGWGEARVVFEYGSHVNGCRIHVIEIWVFDPYDNDREEKTGSAEVPAMPCSWDSDDE